MAVRHPLRPLLVGALGAVLAFGCRAGGANGKADGGAAGDRIVPVTIVPAERKDVQVTLEGLGTVAGYYTVSLKPQVDGRLDRVLFREGQEVRRGQALAQIDPRPFLVQLHQAEGALARDEATLRTHEANLERYKALNGENLVPQQQVDDQVALVGQAKGSILIDRAAVESARLNLSYATVVSPIDGIAGVRLVDPGNLVRASDPSGIVVLTQIDPISVLVTLPQDDLPELTEQMQKGPLVVEAWSRDGSRRLGTGQVLLIDNQINVATGTLRLKAMLPNPDHRLWPNQFVKGRVHLRTIKDALVVPAAAVQRGPDGTLAYVVGQDETASVRPIQVSMIQGEIAVIASGLEPGDQVVIEGQLQLRPGMKVKPRTTLPESSPAPAQPRPKSGRTQGSKATNPDPGRAE